MTLHFDWCCGRSVPGTWSSADGHESIGGNPLGARRLTRTTFADTQKLSEFRSFQGEEMMKRKSTTNSTQQFGVCP